MSASVPLTIALVNGPNLNLLGTREPHHYGTVTLPEIEARFRELAQELGAEASTFQSNHEGALIDFLHSVRLTHRAIVINPGAYTHTSIALRDAISSISLPCWEVHLSNVHRREAFRHHSYISGIAEGVICGLGAWGYEVALRAAVAHLQRKG